MLVWHDPATGRPIVTLEDERQSRAEAEAEARAEREGRAQAEAKLDFTHFERCKRERLQLSGPRWSGVPGHRRLRQTVKNLRR